MSATDPAVSARPGHVVIFDTTLRDGEQAPGFSMGLAQKLELAHALAALGVDVMEAGFAAASPGDEAAIAAIAAEVEGPVICALARANEADIAAAARALAPARKARIHTFIATSPIHRKAKLKMSQAQVRAAAVAAVQHASTFTDDVEFSAEDAMRTEPDFLAEVMQAAYDAGATTLNAPDTVGYATPWEVHARFQALIKAVDRPGAIFSTHCHDDLGLAVANSLAAVQAGARQVEGALNGIGERAGNCAVEEVVMALRTRADVYGVTTGVNTPRLLEASRTLCRVTGQAIARNKAVVGPNAFAHEAGIHQHGMMADASTYEIMRPQDVGFEGSALVLGKHSGRHAFAERAERLGLPLGGNQLPVAFAAFKARADEIGAVDDRELARLLAPFSAAAPRETAPMDIAS